MSDELISFRVSAGEKRQILKLAVLRNETISDYIRNELETAKKYDELKSLFSTRLERFDRLTRLAVVDNDALKSIRETCKDLYYELNNHF